MTDNQTSLAAQYNFDRFDHGRDRAIAEKYLAMEVALKSVRSQGPSETSHWAKEVYKRVEESLLLDPLK
jgi:hypothetical protein